MGWPCVVAVTLDVRQDAQFIGYMQNSAKYKFNDCDIIVNSENHAALRNGSIASRIVTYNYISIDYNKVQYFCEITNINDMVCELKSVKSELNAHHNHQEQIAEFIDKMSQLNRDMLLKNEIYKSDDLPKSVLMQLAERHKISMRFYSLISRIANKYSRSSYYLFFANNEAFVYERAVNFSDSSNERKKVAKDEIRSCQKFISQQVLENLLNDDELTMFLERFMNDLKLTDFKLQTHPDIAHDQFESVIFCGHVLILSALLVKGMESSNANG